MQGSRLRVRRSRQILQYMENTSGHVHKFLGLCLRTWCAILETMRSRASRIVATVILITCLVCPLVELFDNWDHTMQTGNDTEYAFVVLALCVGVAYSFARFIFKSTLLGFVSKRVFASYVQESLFSASCNLALLLFATTSSPPLPLRI
jgi:hypothetical protein